MAAAGLVAVVVSGVGCTPVYGAPCAARQLDGGHNGCFGDCSTPLADGGSPTRDPSDACSEGDGGTP